MNGARTIHSPAAAPAPPPADEYDGQWPDRLSPQTLRRLSEVNGWRTVAALVEEWAGIAAAIALCHWFPNPILYLVAVMFIGARQHALAVLNHEGSHYRLFHNRFWNDAVSDVLLGWPILISVEWFRRFHWVHHRHLGTERDANRKMYRTHQADGRTTRFWTFPKRPWQIAALLLFDLTGLLGLRYLLMTVLRMRDDGRPRWIALQCLLYAAVVWWALAAGWGTALVLYWLVPLCTWFMMTNHLRIIAEHSALPESNDPYMHTRTTLPNLFERIFLLPRNISYHLEHHIYPSIPWYRLPELHRELMALPGYARRARVTKSVSGVFRELIAAETASLPPQKQPET